MLDDVLKRKIRNYTQHVNAIALIFLANATVGCNIICIAAKPRNCIAVDCSSWRHGGGLSRPVARQGMQALGMPILYHGHERDGDDQHHAIVGHVNYILSIMIIVFFDHYIVINIHVIPTALIGFNMSESI